MTRDRMPCERPGELDHPNPFMIYAPDVWIMMGEEIIMRKFLLSVLFDAVLPTVAAWMLIHVAWNAVNDHYGFAPVGLAHSGLLMAAMYFTARLITAGKSSK